MTTPEQRIAGLFGLDETGWARHANPWSGWTRFAILPLFALAVWSRVWIGWWALVPVALVLAWTWLNPRAFPPPRSDRAWITRGVLGERLWAMRHELDLPEHHARPLLAWAVAGALGMPLMAWGLWSLSLGPTLLGMLVIVGGKLGYIRHMVRLHDDTVAARPDLRFRPPSG